MKPCLVDVNVWLALLVRHHVHHRDATEWYESLAAGEAGLCRVVQLGVVRLLGNPSIMDGHPISAVDGWRATEQLLEDERVDFVPDADLVDSLMPKLLTYKIPTPKLVTDAYIAGLAIGQSRRLTTLDRGFLGFDGLDVRLLGR